MQDPELKVAGLHYTLGQEAEGNDHQCSVHSLLCIRSRAPAHGSVPPAVRMALPTSVNAVRAQRFVLQVVVEPSKVTVLATTRAHIESG